MVGVGGRGSHLTVRVVTSPTDKHYYARPSHSARRAAAASFRARAAPTACRVAPRTRTPTQAPSRPPPSRPSTQPPSAPAARRAAYRASTPTPPTAMHGRSMMVNDGAAIQSTVLAHSIRYITRRYPSLLPNSTPCVAGTYQALATDAAIPTPCSACPAGSFQNNPGASTCAKCPAGQLSRADRTACGACAAGEFGE